jgi:redox-sensitive bicupin YhaK (pirin superfamily)
MEKKIAAIYGGTDAPVGDLKVNRLLPNPYIQAVGPFVFLDYLYPYTPAPNKPSPKKGQFAHPHRGIATFSYLLSGELEHYDSAGHFGIVKTGGAQWMKAGNGVIHDEMFTDAFISKGETFHGFQFWINLPGKNKAEAPGYFALQAEEVPEAVLENAGKLRVLIGAYGDMRSPVETYGEQFIYHIQLKPGARFEFTTKTGLEYAVFLPSGNVNLNEQKFGKSELIVFSEDGSEINFYNDSNQTADIMLFGGEPYNEPIVAEGPFVMNSSSEIAEAYSAFFNGNYGKIDYSKQ